MRMATSRLEAFSDGVFAIAATLLILNVQESGSPLGSALLRIWPSYAAYAVSFLTIGIIWINHHTVMAQIGKVDRLFLLLNIIFLMFIAFIPFPTRLLAMHINAEGAEAAAVSYGVVLTLTAIMFNAVWRYAATGRRLLREDADRRVVQVVRRNEGHQLADGGEGVELRVVDEVRHTRGRAVHVGAEPALGLLRERGAAQHDQRSQNHTTNDAHA